MTRRELERESEYASLPRVRHVLHLLLLLLLPESREHAFNAESYIPVDYAHQNLGKRTLYKYSELATRSLKRNMTHFCWKIDRFWRPSAKIYSISVSKHVASRPCHGQVKLTCLPIFLPSFLPACLPACRLAGAQTTSLSNSRVPLFAALLSCAPTNTFVPSLSPGNFRHPVKLPESRSERSTRNGLCPSGRAGSLLSNGNTERPQLPSGGLGASRLCAAE